MGLDTINSVEFDWRGNIPEIVLSSLQFSQIDLSLFDLTAALSPDSRLPEALATTLPPETVANTKRLRRESDRRRSLWSQYILRRLLSERTRRSAGSLVFGKGPYGKPYLVNTQGPHFNLSHAGPMVAIAIAEDDVGVDIECVKHIPLEEEILRMHFAAAELAWYLAHSEAERPCAFYRLWTRKEALAKATGLGLSMPLNSSVLTAPSNRYREWQVLSFPAPAGYCAAVAHRTREAAQLRDSVSLARGPARCRAFCCDN